MKRMRIAVKHWKTGVVLDSFADWGQVARYAEKYEKVTVFPRTLPASFGAGTKKGKIATAIVDALLSGGPMSLLEIERVVASKDQDLAHRKHITTIRNLLMGSNSPIAQAVESSAGMFQVRSDAFAEFWERLSYTTTYDNATLVEITSK
jgi:hypothetical protein